MVNIEIAKCLLEVFFGEVIIDLKSCHYELSQINVARTVCVDNSH